MNTTVQQPPDKTDISALRVPLWTAIAEAIQGGLPAPFQVSLHHFAKTDQINIQMRMGNNAPEDVDAWAAAVGAETYTSEIFEESPPRANWRSYRAGGLGAGVKWHGWDFDVWSAVDEPEDGCVMTTTAKEHLAWCVERAMEYANRGEMVTAWASFASDVTKHEGTAHIATHDLFGMEMVRQVQTRASVRDFQDFISGWAVGS